MSKQGLADPLGSAQPRDYRNYVSDAQLATEYAAYQARYADNPKECDKRTAQLVLQSLQSTQPSGSRPRILDIGCSTGNFLRLTKQLLPNAELVGGDLMKPVIEQCRRDPSLQGIAFEVMDVFDIPSAPPFDVIVANAVSVYFEPDEYRRALASVGRALRPGGSFIAYEWICPGAEQRRITEQSAWHPNGLTFWFRSETFLRDALSEAGFSQSSVEWFELPIDLPKPIPGSRAEATLETYTIKEQGSGRRMMFRGVLHQPWAHIVARKSS